MSAINRTLMFGMIKKKIMRLKQTNKQTNKREKNQEIALFWMIQKSNTRLIRINQVLASSRDNRNSLKMLSAKKKTRIIVTSSNKQSNISINDLVTKTSTTLTLDIMRKSDLFRKETEQNNIMVLRGGSLCIFFSFIHSYSCRIRTHQTHRIIDYITI